MNNKSSTNHLRKYSNKEIDLFIADLKKVQSAMNEKNVHQLRVDIKRIRVVFDLLEMLFPRKLKIKKTKKAITHIFKIAGDIREAQVNYTYFAQYHFLNGFAKRYKRFLKKNETKFGAELKSAINNFDNNLLENSKNKLKQLSEKINDKKVINKCLFLMKTHLIKIKQLLLADENPAIMHKIRMYFKSMDTICALLNKIHPDKQLVKIISLIKQVGILIGNWHDKIILRNSMERFFIKTENISGKDLSEFTKCIKKLDVDDKSIFKKVKTKFEPLSRLVQAANF